MPGSLKEIVHDIVVDGEVSASDVAQSINKPYPTLMRELNPADEGAKLDIGLLIPIMERTGRLDPLEYIAKHFRKVVIDQPDGQAPLTPHNCFSEIAGCTADLGAVADHLVHSLKDGTLDRDECLKAFYLLTTCISTLTTFSGKALAGANR